MSPRVGPMAALRGNLTWMYPYPDIPAIWRRLVGRIKVHALFRGRRQLRALLGTQRAVATLPGLTLRGWLPAVALL